MKHYFRRESFILLILGIASGLPLLLVFGTLSVWLREADVSRSTIGFLSWAGLSYGFKFIWAPLLDHLKLPFLTSKLGRRRSWMLISQLVIVTALFTMAQFDPAIGNTALAGLVFGAVLLGFASATQDIVIDAYRIEIADNDYQAMLSGIVVAGYRIGMLLAGAGALQIAEYFSPNSAIYSFEAWQMAYTVMALVMGLAIITTLIIREPNAPEQIIEIGVYSQVQLVVHFLLVTSVFIAVFSAIPMLFDVVLSKEQPFIAFMAGVLRFMIAIGIALAVAKCLCKTALFDENVAEQVYVVPFKAFFQRYGKLAAMLLAVVCLYRSSDIVMGVIAKVFYVDMGYQKADIGKISFGFGLIMTLLGGILGGILSIRFGLYTMLLAGAILAPVSNLVFIVLATLETPSLIALTAAIVVDNLSGGLAGAVAVAFISSLVDRRFSASQYAVLTSITVLLPKLLAGYSGTLVDSMGYASFFALSACIGIPVIFLILKIKEPYKHLLAH